MDNDKQLGLGRVRQAGSGPAHLATRHIGTEPQRLQSSPWESTQDRLIHDSFVAVARAWRFILTVCWRSASHTKRRQRARWKESIVWSCPPHAREKQTRRSQWTTVTPYALGAGSIFILSRRQTSFNLCLLIMLRFWLQCPTQEEAFKCPLEWRTLSPRI